MLLYTLIAMINYLVNIIVIVVIVQFVLGLLISFNVVNMHNNGVAAIWRALKRWPKASGRRAVRPGPCCMT